MKLFYPRNSLIPKIINLSFFQRSKPCAIILINPRGACIYLLMGFNDYLGPLVNVDGVTSISTISLVDVDVESFSSYIYINQLLGHNTPKLPYGEPLVWEIPRVVNQIFLILLSPLPLPSCSSYAAEVPLGKNAIQNVFWDFVFFF